jgi:hypothetical protein
VGLADAVAAVEVDAAGTGRNASRIRTASLWLDCCGSGMYVAKRASWKRGGGTISAISRSAATTGRRSDRAIGDTSPKGTVRSGVEDCPMCADCFLTLLM